MRAFVCGVVFLCLLVLPPGRASAEEENKESVDQRIENLQREIDTLKSQQTTPTGVQSILLSLVPKVGVVGTFLGETSSQPIDGNRKTTLGLSEGEINFESVVDPYARAIFTFSFPADNTPEVEEGYVSTTSLPYGLQIKAGKFRADWGRINSFHRDALPFADLPNVYQNFFGPEGLVEPGLVISGLIPNPRDQYIAYNVQILRGDNDVSFSGGEADSLLAMGRLKTFFEPTDALGVALGLSAARGANDPSGRFVTTLEGLDVTVNWRPPTQKTYRSLTWQSELMAGQRTGTPDRADSYGLYSYLQYQWAQRWDGGLRYDFTEIPTRPSNHEQSFSEIVNFRPSEFQRITAQFKHTARNFGPDENAAYLRWLFFIGFHPAHSY